MPVIKHNLTPAEKRKRRVRAKLNGTGARPRITVFRSNKNIFVQAINDEAHITLANASDLKMSAVDRKATKTERATKVAEQVFAQLKEQKIKAGIFDRGQYKFHGRVKAVADSLRTLGLEI